MNRTKQKAIIKKLEKECYTRTSLIGYHDYGENLYGFVSPYRIFFSEETYNKEKAKNQFNWNENFSRIDKTYVKIEVELDALLAAAKTFKMGDTPFVLYGDNFKYGINPKYLVDAFNWCGKNSCIEVDYDNPTSPIWVFGKDGKAMIMPMRITQ